MLLDEPNVRRAKEGQAMMRYARIAGCVLVGMVSVFSTSLLSFLVLIQIPREIIDGHRFVGLSVGEAMFHLMVLFGIVLGSFLTGAMCHSLLRSKFGLIGVAPGIYIVLASAVMLPQEFSHVLLAVWILVSWAGVGLGYFTASREKWTMKQLLDPAPGPTANSAVKGYLLAFASLILAVIIEVTPFEADFTGVAILHKDMTSFLVAKLIGLTTILVPLLLYIALNGRQGIVAAKGIVIAIGVIVILRLIFDIWSAVG
jgi:hypothetical protein